MKLLLDGVIVKIKKSSDALTVIDSICYGNEEEVYLQIGDRIRSGSNIISGEAVVQVENTIENCMLSKISNQLNIAQNESENSESGLSVLL